MAKSKLSYVKTIVDKATVSGVLDSYGHEISYIDENGDEAVISLDTFFNDFKECNIDVSVTVKNTKELDFE